MGSPGTGIGRAGIWQAGVEVAPSSNTRFSFEATSTLAFSGVWFNVGHFVLESDADLLFSGQAWAYGDFSFEADAFLDFAGTGIHFGAFDLEGVAELDFIWMPSLCPGTFAVGCAVGPASVTDVFIPAQASVSSRKDC